MLDSGKDTRQQTATVAISGSFPEIFRGNERIVYTPRGKYLKTYPFIIRMWLKHVAQTGQG